MGRPPRFSRGSHQPREERAETEPRPYRFIVVCSGGLPYLGHGLRRPNFVPKFGASVIGIGPYGEKGKPHRPPWPAEQSICASGHKGWVGHAAEIIPKVSSNLGQSLNRGIAATAPFAQGSLWPAGDEKAGGHIGPPLRGHRSAQQRQAGRDRARPLQKDGEYAEGWGDERTQGRFDIYRAVIGLVSRKAECPE